MCQIVEEKMVQLNILNICDTYYYIINISFNQQLAS